MEKSIDRRRQVRPRHKGIQAIGSLTLQGAAIQKGTEAHYRFQAPLIVKLLHSNSFKSSNKFTCKKTKQFHTFFGFLECWKTAVNDMPPIWAGMSINITYGQNFAYLWIEPIYFAWSHSTGSARSLISRCPGNRRNNKALNPSACIVPFDFGETAVNDICDPGNRNGCFCNIRGDNNLSDVGWSSFKNLKFEEVSSRPIRMFMKYLHLLSLRESTIHRKC